jgi:hypothetical protein
MIKICRLYDLIINFNNNLSRLKRPSSSCVCTWTYFSDQVEFKLEEWLAVLCCGDMAYKHSIREVACFPKMKERFAKNDGKCLKIAVLLEKGHRAWKLTAESWQKL